MRRLLYIAHRVPYPPDKGERVRAFHEIRALAGRFRVTVAALAHDRADREAAEGLRPWCEGVITARAGGRLGLVRGGLGLLGGRSVTEGFFRSRRLARLLREEARRDPFDVVLAYSSGAVPYALAVPARVRVADLVDADSAKWAAYAERSPWPVAWLYRREAEGVRRLERRALAECDAVVLVSRAEAAALGPAGAGALAVGNGVDIDYFRPRGRPPGRPPTLVFTGTMDYRPNVEGVCWFAERVWPALRRDVPALRLVVVGRRPTRAVRRLAERPGIEVTGTVPDVRPFLAEAHAAVVPLLTARGVQNKVLEAMAMGRAVVASPPALEGLDVERGGEVLEAPSPEAWRRHVVSLLHDGDHRQAVERAAREAVERRFAWTARMRPLVDLCERLAGNGPSSEAAGGEAAHAPTAAAEAGTIARKGTVP